MTEYTLKFSKAVPVEGVVANRKCNIVSECVHMVDDKPYMAGKIAFNNGTDIHAFFTPLRQAEFIQINTLSAKERQALFDKDFVTIRINARLGDLTISAGDSFKDIFGAIRKVRAAMDRAIMEAINPSTPKVDAQAAQAQNQDHTVPSH